MSDQESARIAELFARACELDGEERERFLQESCGNDAVLLEELRSLLPHHQDEFLENPDHLVERSPESIGPYRIIRELGAGGMGLVYLAEQQEPVRREVALKLIKLGMDTREVVARFDTERQALALMNHPGIARVYDAGATEEGRPYFVMEYVKGLPITEHCDRARLNKRNRLTLFVEVCKGLQHAHQKGVIHRDIKSSNVLVTMQDGEPVPKIIDFGIAKATDRRLTEATVYTEMGQIIGTPEYMSPEQADLTGQDIDTRTDIYSLGVLLYFLLVGEFPFDSQALRSQGFDELRRIIREDDPPKPSMRFTSLGQRGALVSRDRRSDPDTFVRELRGDLDWIVMKALDKDPARRYASAAEFAADVQRQLDGDPVLARPPSAGYRVGKFVRKHRVGVAFVVVVVLAMLFGIVGTTTGMLRAMRAEDRAQAEARTAEEVSEYLTKIFDQADLGSDAEMRQAAKRIIDSGADGIDAIEDDNIRRRLMSVMGRLYRTMDFMDDARPLIERAVEIDLKAPGAKNQDSFAAFNLLGTLEMKDKNWERAEELYLVALEIGDQIFENPDHESLAAVLKNLGDANVYLHEESDTTDSENQATSCGGNCKWLSDARKFHQRALGMRTRSGSQRVYASLSGMALVHRKSGDLAEAIRLYGLSLEERRKLFPPGDPKRRVVAIGGVQLGETLIAAEEYSQAVPLFEEALEILERVSTNPNHRDIRNACFNLARCLAKIRRLPEAESYFRRAIGIDEHNHGSDAPDLVERLEGFADALEDGSREAEAKELRERVERIRAVHSET